MIWIVCATGLAVIGYATWKLLRASEDDDHEDLHMPPQQRQTQREQTYEELCVLMARTLEQIRRLPEIQREEWLV
jgi:hypothetical protein